MYKCKYYDGQMVNGIKLIKVLPSKIFGTQGRKVGMGLFECSLCGSPFECMITSVKASTKSCGCLAKKISSAVHKKHGKTGSKEYNSWQCVKNRCMNINAADYANYGGRGIRVYDKWVDSFESFLNYIGYAPSKKHTIDRINVNGNYEPGNIRWATKKEQANNKRKNTIIEHNGFFRTLMQWSEISGIHYYTLSGRLKRNWSIGEALSVMPSLSNRYRNK